MTWTQKIYKSYKNASKKQTHLDMMFFHTNCHKMWARVSAGERGGERGWARVSAGVSAGERGRVVFALFWENVAELMCDVSSWRKNSWFDERLQFWHWISEFSANLHLIMVSADFSEKTWHIRVLCAALFIKRNDKQHFSLKNWKFEVFLYFCAFPNLVPVFVSQLLHWQTKATHATSNGCVSSSCSNLLVCIWPGTIKKSSFQ